MPGSCRSPNMSAPAHAIRPEPQDAPGPPQGATVATSSPTMIDDQPSHQPRKQVHGTRIFLASQWLLRLPRRPPRHLAPGVGCPKCQRCAGSHLSQHRLDGSTTPLAPRAKHRKHGAGNVRVSTRLAIAGTSRPSTVPPPGCSQNGCALTRGFWTSEASMSLRSPNV